MRYQTLGVVGYGFQVAALLILAAVSSVLFATTFVIRGIEVTGIITPIPALLIALTWLYAGRDTKSGLFTATGVVGVLSSATGVATSLWASASGTLATLSSQGIPEELVFVLAVSSVSGLLAVMTFVLETVSFFSAGRLFAERMFRLAGWSRIAAVVAAGAFLFVVLIVALLSSVPVNSGSTSTLLSLQISPNPAGQFPHLFGVALGGVYLIMTVPDAFAFIGFRRLLSTPKPGTSQAEAQGTPVPQPTVPRYCTSCGNPAIPGARYCGSCGKAL